jgi:hypothetical protein
MSRFFIVTLSVVTLNIDVCRLMRYSDLSFYIISLIFLNLCLQINESQFKVQIAVRRYFSVKNELYTGDTYRREGSALLALLIKIACFV